MHPYPPREQGTFPGQTCLGRITPMIGAALEGLLHVFDLANFVSLFIGVFMGIVFGALPGLTATMGLALLIPFTFTMSPEAGLIMLGGIYVGSMYGDAIPAVLINTPGTPSAIATTFDGYPLTQKGMAQHGLIAAAFASAYGSIAANILLATAAPRWRMFRSNSARRSISGWEFSV
jgi:putative tricarboxylic transport membrane protein